MHALSSSHAPFVIIGSQVCQLHRLPLLSINLSREPTPHEPAWRIFNLSARHNDQISSNRIRIEFCLSSCHPLSFRVSLVRQSLRTVKTVQVIGTDDLHLLQNRATRLKSDISIVQNSISIMARQSTHLPYLKRMIFGKATGGSTPWLPVCRSCSKSAWQAVCCLSRVWPDHRRKFLVAIENKCHQWLHQLQGW